MELVRVLMIEDESFVRFVTSEHLRDEGFDVTEAWDGDEATKLLDVCPAFDMIFTDVNMPGLLDGIALAVHARHRQPNIPILVVSGYSGFLRTRLDPLQPGAEFLPKPYSLHELVHVLKRMIPGK